MEGVVMLSPVAIFDFRSIRAIGIEHLACRFNAKRWIFDDRSYAIIGQVVRKTLGLLHYHIYVVDRLQNRRIAPTNYTASVLIVEKRKKRSYIRAPVKNEREVGERADFGHILIILVDVVERKKDPNWTAEVGEKIIEKQFDGTPVEYSVAHPLLVVSDGVRTDVENVVWNGFLDTLLACNFPTLFERADRDAFALREKKVGRDKKYMLYKMDSQLSIRYMELLGSTMQYTEPTIACNGLHAILTRLAIDMIAAVDQVVNRGSTVLLSRIKLPIGALW